MDRFQQQPLADPRVRQARTLGLPNTATWEEIAHYRMERFRISAAQARGLSARSTWEAIYAHDELLNKGKIHADVFREHSAIGRGLPCTASWYEIIVYDREQDLDAAEALQPTRTPLFFDIDPTTGKRR